MGSAERQTVIHAHRIMHLRRVCAGLTVRCWHKYSRTRVDIQKNVKRLNALHTYQLNCRQL